MNNKGIIGLVAFRYLSRYADVRAKIDELLWKRVRVHLKSIPIACMYLIEAFLTSSLFLTNNENSTDYNVCMYPIEAL